MAEFWGHHGLILFICNTTVEMHFEVPQFGTNLLMLVLALGSAGSPLPFNIIMGWTVLSPILVVSAISLVVFYA